MSLCFFFQAEDGIRDGHVTGVQTCALPIWAVNVCLLFRKTTVRTGWLIVFHRQSQADRKRVVLGKSVDRGGRRSMKGKEQTKMNQLDPYSSRGIAIF